MLPKQYLLDSLVVLLGGRVAEQLIFGEVTTGAAGDLKRAHEISRQMITEFGMGAELFSKSLPTDDYSMSDFTRQRVDEEQLEITDIAHRRATNLVAENRLLLEAFAHTLLDKEVLEREDIEKLVEAHRGTREGRFVRDRAETGHDNRLAASERFIGSSGD